MLCFSMSLGPFYARREHPLAQAAGPLGLCCPGVCSRADPRRRSCCLLSHWGSSQYPPCPQEQFHTALAQGPPLRWATVPPRLSPHGCLGPGSAQDRPPPHTHPGDLKEAAAAGERLAPPRLPEQPAMPWPPQDQRAPWVPPRGTLAGCLLGRPGLSRSSTGHLGLHSLHSFLRS